MSVNKMNYLGDTWVHVNDLRNEIHENKALLNLSLQLYQTELKKTEDPGKSLQTALNYFLMVASGESAGLKRET